jgi:hypothetical protein
MIWKNLRRLAAMGLAVLGIADVSAATISVNGYLYGTNHWSATNEYVLSGFTYVMGNSVLNIEAGTVIKGVPGTGTGASAANDFGCLFVCRGGKINAMGTAARPVIMTAEADDVTDPADLPFPSRGLWGGLVVFGNARINNPAFTTNSLSFDIYEGLPDTAVTNGVSGQVDFIHRFGGLDDADSSGNLRFVSIRHGGKKLTTDKEINGLSLCGVGNGTAVDFVEAYCIADDGFEFFGGSVNTKHLVSAFNDDESFDTDQGYNGKNQFWFGIHSADARDEGSEQNGQPQPNDILVPGALPLANYTVYNATLVGGGTTGSGNDAHNLRRANFARWYNGVFTEFQGRRVTIDGTSTPEFANNIFFAFAGGAGDVYGTHASVPAALNPVVDPQLRAIDRTVSGKLDPRPATGSPVFSDVRSTPVDGFYSLAPFKGAFDAQDVWIDGWTALAQEGISRTKTNVVTVPAGYLYGNNNWVSSNIYVLQGFVYVMSNAVLNIEPGTIIKGVPGTGTGASAANDFGCLFVCRGGKINAVGTPNNPIIMTAEADDVADLTDLPFPSRGLWGGLVMFGNARINNPSFTTNAVSYDIYEGLLDTTVTQDSSGQVDLIHRFGGLNDDDSSGIVRYVSIRHGGKKLTTDKEINGLSLCGVGRGTEIDFVEAYCIADDGFEFFGGSVNTKHLVAAFNDDESFDTDQGYNGKNQFWFAIHSPDARDEGSEQNGQPQPNDVLVPGALPLANYTIYNATLIGAGSTGSGNDAHNLRRANFARWYNGVFTDFQGRRVTIDGTSTPDFANNIFFGFAGGAGDVYGTHPSVPAALNPVVDPMLQSISRTTAGLLNPTVKEGSPVYSDYRPVPADGFYSPAPFKGAFASVNWAQDWSALGAYGFLTSTMVPATRPVPMAEVASVTSAADGSSLTVVFGTRAGVRYQVQASTDGSAWTNEGGWLSGTGGNLSAVVPVPGVRRLVRVVTSE